nr:N-acetylmuramoyl-L-alanine amidase [uncultured Chryseobacterium sp.]
MKGINLLALSVFSTLFLSFTPLSQKYVVINASYGGNDPVSVYGNFFEKEISLNIARELQNPNKNQDKHEAALTRNSDSYSSLSERTDQINKLNPEMVISLHVNRSSGQEIQPPGFEVYVQNSETSKMITGKMSKKFNACIIEGRDLHMLKETKAPAVLAELDGFINNTVYRSYITSEKG